ncbi:MAG: hypothetical protein E7575_05505 [Ruminococcaceae bacterium]|nr:hypothetical protein [Oscillospiraceae bacterium]
MAKYTLDVGRRGRQFTIEGLHVGDNGFRTYEFAFISGGDILPLPDGCIATLYARLKSGTTVYDTCVIEGDTVKYVLRGGDGEGASITSEAGLVECELRLTSADGNILTSPKFTMMIDSVLQDSEEIEAQESFSALTDALSRVLEAESGLASKVGKVEGVPGNAVIFGEGGAIADSGRAPARIFTVYYDESGDENEKNRALLDPLNSCLNAGIEFAVQMDLGDKVCPCVWRKANVPGTRWIFIGADNDDGLIYTVDIRTGSVAYETTDIYEWDSFDENGTIPATQKLTAKWVKEQIAEMAPVLGEDYFTAEVIAAALEEYFKEKPIVTVETDPTVPEWAKQPEKPTYTAEEVGALPSSYTPPTQTADQVGADPKGTADSKVSAHNTATDSHNDIRTLINELTTRLNTIANSTDTDLDQLSELVAYIKANRTLIDSITTSKVSVSDIINNLTTNVSNKPLSAAQGVVLKALIDAITVPTKLSQLSGDTTHRTVTDAEKTSWNAKSDFSGAYADLTGQPTIPTVPTNVSAFENDVGYIKESELDSAVDAALTKAKESGEFDGDTGERGTGILKVTTSTTSASGTGPTGIAIKYKIALSTVKSEAGVDEVLIGDIVERSYYHYQVANVDESYVYLGAYTSIRGATGPAGATGPQGPAGETGPAGADGADGYTPVKGVDYYTEDEQSEWSEYIASELAKRGQLKPEFAQSTEWLNANGDTSKMYVLPDGFIYAYMLTEKEVETEPSYKNWLTYSINADGSDYKGDNGEDGYRKGYRYSASSAVEKAQASHDCVGFIPAKAGDIVRIANVTRPTSSNDGSAYACAYFFDSSFAKTNGQVIFKDTATYENGVLSWTVPSYNNIAYFKATLMGVSDETIITVNEEITEGGGSGGTTTVTEYAWVSTGLAFVPADYEDRIIDLENEVSQNSADIASLKKGITTSTPIKTWDAPIYDANIPVFELAIEKSAITSDELTVDAVYAKYDALMARHPNYITKTDLGLCSDGVQHVYRYDFREPEPHRGTTGKKEWSETKTKAIIISGIHWEWGGIFALYNALEEIADNPALFDFKRNTHIIVLPVCNPYAVANQSVRNANQVEIHRNFEVDFIYPNEEGYIEIGERSHGGTAPLSEVETQYIDNIMKNNTDAAFFLTCHSCQGDEVYGTSFIWSSPATYHMCNMAYRLIDKLSNAWNDKYGDELADGIADYRTSNLPEWDRRLGMAYLSTTNGSEQKQATKYGIQGTNIEITDAFLTHGTKANPEAYLSSFTMSRGAEVYVNFLLTAFGVYDHKDKEQYAPTVTE